MPDESELPYDTHFDARDQRFVKAYLETGSFAKAAISSGLVAPGTARLIAHKKGVEKIRSEGIQSYVFDVYEGIGGDVAEILGVLRENMLDAKKYMLNFETNQSVEIGRDYQASNRAAELLLRTLGLFNHVERKERTQNVIVHFGSQPLDSGHGDGVIIDVTPTSTDEDDE